MTENRKMPPLASGVPVARFEAMSKVRAEERYAADIQEENMLWAVARRAGVPSARVKSISTERAASAPGVVAVLTYKDVKGTNLLGLIQPDQPVLVEDRVRYAGDPLCLVIAESPEAAEKGSFLVEADLETLPAVFDPELALKEDSPRLYPDRPRGNLIIEGYVRRGDLKAAFEECEYVEEETFYFPPQEHAYLETESGIAKYEDGMLSIEVSTQNPWRDRDELSRALGLPRENIRVVAPCLGGGFGGKDGVVIQGLLGLAALCTDGRPVKMVFSREESFLCSPKRHSSVTTMTLGCDSLGKLKALKCRILLDGGAYESMSVPVLMNGLDHVGGCYPIDVVDIEGKAAYTNNPFGGAFRAFGAPQVEGALEQLVDRLARLCDMDPLEFRLKNALVRGDRNASGVTLTGTVGIVPCLEKLKQHPLWKEREEWERSAPVGKLRSTGIAAIVHGQGFGPGIPDFANARIEITPKGTFRIVSGISDMGQGNSSTYIQLAGELLCQGADRFEMVQPDTDLALRSGPAAASRTTYMYGKALLDAAAILKERMIRKAGMILGAEEKDLVLLPGLFRNLKNGRELPLEVLYSFMESPERCAVAGFLAPTSDVGPETEYAPRGMGFPHCIFSWGAHLARIEVNCFTGEVEVSDYLAVTEAGRVINPLCWRQQVEGGVAQGLGYALMEDFEVEDGIPLTPDLSTYIVPTVMDVPRFYCPAVELDEPTGPKGLKGLGELPLIGPLPAVGNALAHLSGHILTRSPFTAERVLAALEKESDMS